MRRNESVSMRRPLTGVSAFATKLAKVEYAKPAVNPASKLNFSEPADRSARAGWLRGCAMQASSSLAIVLMALVERNVVKGERRATVRLDQAETRLVYRFRLTSACTSNLLVSTK